MTPKGEVQTERERVAEWLWNRDERQEADTAEDYTYYLTPWRDVSDDWRREYLEAADSLLALLPSPRQPPEQSVEPLTPEPDVTK